MKASQLTELLALEDGERDEHFYRDLLAGTLIGIDEDELYLYVEPRTFDWHPDEGRFDVSAVYDELKKAIEKVEDMDIPIINLEDIDPLTLKEWWVEWRTNGIVYSRVLGTKKSYRFTPKIPELIAFKFMEIPPVIEKTTIPSFEVAVDTISIKVKKDGRKVRRFWEYRGVIEVWFVARTIDGKKIERKIGEIKVDWKGQKRLLKDAKKRVKELKKLRKKLEEMRKKAEGKMKARITRELKKIERSLSFWLKAKNRHYKTGLQLWGQIGDYRIKRIVFFKKKKGKKTTVKRKTVYNEIVDGYWVVKKDVQKLRYGNQEIIIMDIDSIDTETLNVRHKTVTNREYQFYGRYGKLNHRLKVVAVPQRKIEVAVLAQAREKVFRKYVKTIRHAIEVFEIEGDEKIWVIRPTDSSKVARFVIINRDHRKEGMDRVLVHLDNQVMLFIHKL